MSVSADSRTIFVSWNMPKFVPYQYKLGALCYQLGRGMVYVRKGKTVGSFKLHVYGTIKDILPGSTCEVKLVALYNPVRIDPGIVRIISTKSVGKHLSI